ncbi:hypothetical protein N9D08_01270 [bacterium]|nr:hypothetical protein [bacterium]
MAFVPSLARRRGVERAPGAGETARARAIARGFERVRDARARCERAGARRGLGERWARRARAREGVARESGGATHVDVDRGAGSAATTSTRRATRLRSSETVRRARRRACGGNRL